MITTILLDVGGTIFIKNEQGQGILNPAIIYLNEHLSQKISVILFSDTDEFDVPELLQRTFPNLRHDGIYTKKMYPWIDKTKPETYTKLCTVLEKQPSECILIDNLQEFRSAAESAGIRTYDVDQKSINQILMEVK